VTDESTSTTDTTDTTVEGGFVVPPESVPPLDPAIVALAKSAGPTCLVCGDPLEVYTGDNPHKLGTGWCVVDGRQRF
jgi:hypothetical protein